MNHPPPIAIQLYTLREALARDWRGVLARLAEIGYRGVETAGFAYAPVNDVAAELAHLSLAVPAAHSALPLGADKNRVLDEMAALGCQRLVIGGTDREQFGAPDAVRRQAERFNEANAVARAAGLSFGLHNHWWEFAQLNGALAYDLLLAELDPTIFLEVDIYWAQTAGVDAEELLRRLGARAPLLHVKDGPAVIDAPHVAVGQGAVDVPAALAAARPHVEWAIVELDHCATDMMTAVAASYTYLTENGLATGAP